MRTRLLDPIPLPRSTASAVQVACTLYVGVQLLLPGEDAGIDLARELEAGAALGKYAAVVAEAS
jgi:hypothetical protein